MRLLHAGAAVALSTALLASPALAASPFDGRWKIDLAAGKPSGRLDVRTILGGEYACTSCLPPFKVPADGAFHPLADQPGLDELAVQVIGADTVRQTNRLKGRVVREETLVLSPGGQAAVLSFTDTINPGLAPVTGKQTLIRVAAGPAGSHALSGSWRPQEAQVSGNGLTQTLKIEGGVFSLNTAEGFSYTAPLDGTATPTHGDPFIDSVSVQRLGERQLRETDLHQGAPIATYTMTVSPDGSTLTTVLHNEKSGATRTIVAHRL